MDTERHGAWYIPDRVPDMQQQCENTGEPPVLPNIENVIHFLPNNIGLGEVHKGFKNESGGLCAPSGTKWNNATDRCAEMIQLYVNLVPLFHFLKYQFLPFSNLKNLFSVLQGAFSETERFCGYQRFFME